MLGRATLAITIALFASIAHADTATLVPVAPVASVPPRFFTSEPQRPAAPEAPAPLDFQLLSDADAQRSADLALPSPPIPTLQDPATVPSDASMLDNLPRDVDAAGSAGGNAGGSGSGSDIAAIIVPQELDVSREFVRRPTTRLRMRVTF